MTDLAELISAIAALLWPIVAFTALWMFRSELRTLFKRLKRGKVFGQEIELQESLLQLEVKAEQAATEAAAIPDPESQSEYRNTTDTTAQIIGEVSRSPKAALLLLAAEIERQLRDLLLSLGLGSERPINFRQGIALLDTRHALPPHVSSSAKLFWDVRSRIVHGRESTENDVVSAIDSGLLILRALQIVPREANYVYHPGVPVYADGQAIRLRENVRGVILETSSPGGAKTLRRIFPTTRDHFKKGQRVAWEWNMAVVIGESWYRDPDSNELKYAWTQSAEFIGRGLDDV